MLLTPHHSALHGCSRNTAREATRRRLGASLATSFQRAKPFARQCSSQICPESLRHSSSRLCTRAVPPGLQYGVELELFFGKDVKEEHVAAVIPNGWIVKKEESIKCCQDEDCVCTPLEVVSPVLRGEQGLADIRAACSALEPLHPNVNKTTGLHVHVGTLDGVWQLDHLRHIATNFMHHEPAFDLLVPPSRRGNDNIHIRSLCDLPKGNERALHSAPSLVSLVLLANPGDRQYKLNLHALERHNTVEFRQPAGCYDAKKILGYVCLFLAFVERSRTATCAGPDVKKEQKTQGYLQHLKAFLAGEADEELQHWIDERARHLALADEIRAHTWRTSMQTHHQDKTPPTDLSTVLAEIHASDVLTLEQ